MNLSTELREQAWHLARKEPKKPRQVSLRRAVSAAYYAVFHLLIESATNQFASNRNLAGVRQVLARAYGHAEMKDCSRAFAGATLPASVTPALPGVPVPPDLVLVARAFIDLQQARHDADYNPALTFQRADILDKLQQMDDAFAAWRRVRHEPMAILYLGLLGSYDSVRRR